MVRAAARSLLKLKADASDGGRRTHFYRKKAIGVPSVKRRVRRGHPGPRTCRTPGRRSRHGSDRPTRCLPLSLLTRQARERATAARTPPDRNQSGAPARYRRMSPMGPVPAPAAVREISRDFARLRKKRRRRSATTGTLGLASALQCEPSDKNQ